MSSESPKRERGRPKGRKPTYNIHTSIDEAIGLDLEEYMATFDYEPRLKAVIERALKLLFKEDKFEGSHSKQYKQDK